MAYEKTCSKGEWDYRDNDNIFGGGSTHWPPLSLSPNEAGEDSNAQIRPGDDLRGCLRETLSESWQIKAIQFEPSPCSYLHIAKPSALEPRNEMSFMEWYPKGGASISFQGDDGHIDTIDGINVFLIESRCQLLATAFEHSKSGPQLFLAALSSSTAIPFVRYLYTGSYALQKVDGDVFDDVPTSVLLHCQLFRLGVLYDLSELKTQAYVNVLRQCEFGCSSPSKPIDLCVAIRYMYQHLREQEQLIDAVVQYCVSCFFHHRLDVDPEFCKLAYELRPLHQDMCRILRDRDFEDDTAAAIIRMPCEPHVPQSLHDDSAKHDKLASALKPPKDSAARSDVMHHFHESEEERTPPTKKKPEDQSAPIMAAMSSSRLPLQDPATLRAGDQSVAVKDGHESGRKCRASLHATSLIRGGLAGSESSAYKDLIAMKSADADTLPEAGFELVGGSLSPDALGSDGEWEWAASTSQADDPADSIDHRAIPIRLRVATPRTNHVDGFISEPELSDWTLV